MEIFTTLTDITLPVTIKTLYKDSTFSDQMKIELAMNIYAENPLV
jgi:hypothetical protein